MAVDFQIVFPNEAIKINAVTVLEGSSPLVAEVLGQDFSSVDEVLVNDIPAPSYYVASRTRLFVTLPDSVNGDNIEAVSVTSKRLVLTEKSLLKFRIGKLPSKAVGILRLMQVFVKLLFTTPGSDSFNKTIGGGALRNIGRTFNKAETGGIVSDFVVAVDSTARQLISLQSRQPKLPADERLVVANVLSANFDMQNAALIASIELISQAGQSAVTSVVF